VRPRADADGDGYGNGAPIEYGDGCPVRDGYGHVAADCDADADGLSPD
jgi:hypothetical protein